MNSNSIVGSNCVGCCMNNTCAIPSNQNNNQNNRPTSYIQEATRYDGKLGHTIAILTISVTTLIVALAWRDYVDFTIKKNFITDPENSQMARFWYALIATIATVIIIMFLVAYFRTR